VAEAVILFKPCHVAPILARVKTQTRRLHIPFRWRVGAVHGCFTDMRRGARPFARVRILRRWSEPLGAISEADARAEGYGSREDYLRAFEEMNRKAGAVDLGREVSCYEFELVSQGRRDECV